MLIQWSTAKEQTRLLGMTAHKAHNLLSHKGLFSYFNIGDKAYSLKGIILLSPLTWALVKLNCT